MAFHLRWGDELELEVPREGFEVAGQLLEGTLRVTLCDDDEQLGEQDAVMGRLAIKVCGAGGVMKVDRATVLSEDKSRYSFRMNLTTECCGPGFGPPQGSAAKLRMAKLAAAAKVAEAAASEAADEAEAAARAAALVEETAMMAAEEALAKAAAAAAARDAGSSAAKTTKEEAEEEEEGADTPAAAAAAKAMAAAVKVSKAADEVLAAMEKAEEAIALLEAAIAAADAIGLAMVKELAVMGEAWRRGDAAATSRLGDAPHAAKTLIGAALERPKSAQDVRQALLQARHRRALGFASPPRSSTSPPRGKDDRAASPPLASPAPPASRAAACSAHAPRKLAWSPAGASGAASLHHMLNCHVESPSVTLRVALAVPAPGSEGAETLPSVLDGTSASRQERRAARVARAASATPGSAARHRVPMHVSRAPASPASPASPAGGSAALGRAPARHANEEATKQQLYNAAARGDAKRLRTYLSPGLSPEKLDFSGSSSIQLVPGCSSLQLTPLHAAVKHGHLEAARMLLAAGASVHSLDEFGSTPLHTACRMNHEPIVRLLLHHKADATAMNKQGVTAFDCALIRHRNPLVIQALCQHSQGARPARLTHNN